MKRFAWALIVIVVTPLAGCRENKNPSLPPPASRADAEKASGIDVDVQAPGVDVKVERGKVDVKAPGADVEVRKKPVD